MSIMTQVFETSFDLQREAIMAEVLLGTRLMSLIIKGQPGDVAKVVAAILEEDPNTLVDLCSVFSYAELRMQEQDFLDVVAVIERHPELGRLIAGSIQDPRFSFILKPEEICFKISKKDYLAIMEMSGL